MTDSTDSPWQRSQPSAARLPVVAARPRAEAGPAARVATSLEPRSAEFQHRLVQEAFGDLGGVGGIPFAKGDEDDPSCATPAGSWCRAPTTSSGSSRSSRSGRTPTTAAGAICQLFGDLVAYDLPTRTATTSAHDIACSCSTRSTR